jgi:hypothetical protein
MGNHVVFYYIRRAAHPDAHNLGAYVVMSDGIVRNERLGYILPKINPVCFVIMNAIMSDIVVSTAII